MPGNVRQLRNAVEKMVVLSGGGKLTIDDVPMEIRENAVPVQAQAVAAAAPAEAKAEVKAAQAAPELQSLADSEKEKILAVLESVKGNKSKAAEILGISRRTIHRKLNEWQNRT